MRLHPSQAIFFYLVSISSFLPHPLFAQPSKPLVAVSLPPQAFFVNKIADGLVDVKVMIPPSANHEAYEPTIDLFKDIARAKIYLLLGHPRFSFEVSWLEHFARTNAEMKIVNTSFGLAIDPEDPHLWVSPDCVRAMVRNITQALEALLPDDRDLLEQNLTRFLAEIDSLDHEIQGLFKGKRQNSFLVFHPEWGYFAKEYGLEQIAIEKEGTEVDPKTLASIIAIAKSKGIKTVFVSPQFSDEAAQVVAKEIGGSVEILNSLRYDWTENIREAAYALKKALS